VWSWQLTSVVLFGSVATKALYEPVMLQLGLPVGAVIFWMRRDPWLLLLPPPASTAENIT
jgi:hypothetical protein